MNLKKKPGEQARFMEHMAPVFPLMNSGLKGVDQAQKQALNRRETQRRARQHGTYEFGSSMPATNFDEQMRDERAISRARAKMNKGGSTATRENMLS